MGPSATKSVVNVCLNKTNNPSEDNNKEKILLFIVMLGFISNQKNFALTKLSLLDHYSYCMCL